MPHPRGNGQQAFALEKRPNCLLIGKGLRDLRLLVGEDRHRRQRPVAALFERLEGHGPLPFHAPHHQQFLGRVGHQRHFTQEPHILVASDGRVAFQRRLARGQPLPIGHQRAARSGRRLTERRTRPGVELRRQFARHRGQACLDVAERLDGQAGKGSTHVRQVDLRVRQHHRGVAQALHDRLRPSTVERRWWQQQVERRPQCLLNEEGRIPAPRGRLLEFPSHSRDGGSHQAIVDLTRHGHALRRQAAPPRLERTQGLVTSCHRLGRPVG